MHELMRERFWNLFVATKHQSQRQGNSKNNRNGIRHRGKTPAPTYSIPCPPPPKTQK